MILEKLPTALRKSIGVGQELRGLRVVVSADSVRALGMSWTLYIHEDICLDMVGIQKNELFKSNQTTFIGLVSFENYYR